MPTPARSRYRKARGNHTRASRCARRERDAHRGGEVRPALNLGPRELGDSAGRGGRVGRRKRSGLRPSSWLGGFPLVGGGAEYIRSKLVAGDLPVGRRFDQQAAGWRDRTRAREPLMHRRRLNANRAGKSRNAAVDFYSPFDQCLHVASVRHCLHALQGIAYAVRREAQ